MKNIIDVAKVIDNPSALTQEQGDVINSLIVPYLKKHENITLDFSNVESMISPFLNNAIGKLYGSFTSEEIQKYLVFSKFPKEKINTLNLVISNAKKYYTNKDIFEKAVKEVIDNE